MTVRQKLSDMEAQLNEAGSNVTRFCTYADIARSTWDRWKSERHAPNMGKWLDVEAKFSQYLTELKDAA